MNSQHFLVHVIHFGIFDQKIAPKSASYVPQNIFPSLILKAVFNLGDLRRQVGRQCPLSHFVIRRGRQIHPANRRELAGIIAQCDGLQPVAVLFQRTEEILHYHENQALVASQLNEGARGTLASLRARGIHVGVLTRNRKCNALAIAEKHALDFDAVVGREDGPVKPDAFGVLHLCRHFGVEPAETMLVGDYLYDLLCARAAGAIPVLISLNPTSPQVE